MDDDLNRPNDRAGLARLARPLVADPPVATAPLGEIRRRAARRARQRTAALAVIVVAVLAVGGTALARSGREGPGVRVGTTPTGPGQPDITVWLDPHATPSQVAAVQADLWADPNVVSLTYSDQAAAYAQFRCYFHDEPDLAESVRPNEVPARFSVDVVGGQAEVDRLYARLHAAPGVQQFTTRPPYTTPVTATTYTIPPGAAVGTMVVRDSGVTVKPYPGGCPLTGTTLR